jgi:hypothetical protein
MVKAGRMAVKIKIGDKMYLTDNEPVMLIFTDQDKANIAAIHKDCDRIAYMPDTWTTEQEEEFMEVSVNECENIKIRDVYQVIEPPEAPEETVTPEPDYVCEAHGLINDTSGCEKCKPGLIGRFFRLFDKNWCK